MVFHFKNKKTETEKDLKQKQFDVIQSIQTLSKSSEKFAREAEEKQDFTLLTKYNIFRSSAKEKNIDTLINTLKVLKDKKTAL